MDEEMVNCRAFFKVFLPETCARELNIPSTFIQSIEGALPKNVALRDRYNNLWHLKVEKVGDHWCFTDGWIKFVEDNSIKGGDMLVFKYSCEGLFDIKILGPFACEKKGVGGPICKSTEEQTKTIEEEDKDGVEGQDDDLMFVRQQQNQQDSDREEQVDAAGANPHESRRNDWYGAEIFISGLAPEPVNPYFMTKTRRKRPHELYVPNDVIEHHNLELPREILLFDPNGRKFRAKSKTWKDGRIFYTGGWKSLCKMNLLEEDDRCICEFVQGEGGNLCLNISFVRANRHQG